MKNQSRFHSPEFLFLTFKFLFNVRHQTLLFFCSSNNGKKTLSSCHKLYYSIDFIEYFFFFAQFICSLMIWMLQFFFPLLFNWLSDVSIGWWWWWWWRWSTFREKNERLEWLILFFFYSNTVIVELNNSNIIIIIIVNKFESIFDLFEYEGDRCVYVCVCVCVYLILSSNLVQFISIKILISFNHLSFYTYHHHL